MMPTIKQAGLDQMQRNFRSVTLVLVPVIVRGSFWFRNKTERTFADHIFPLRPFLKLGVVANDNQQTISSRLQQAPNYTQITAMQSAHSSNGDGFAEQRRNIAKVDGQIALCEALKPRFLAAAAQSQHHFADAVIEGVTA
jgi:hypothetical protein